MINMAHMEWAEASGGAEAMGVFLDDSVHRIRIQMAPGQPESGGFRCTILYVIIVFIACRMPRVRTPAQEELREMISDLLIRGFGLYVGGIRKNVDARHRSD